MSPGIPAAVELAGVNALATFLNDKIPAPSVDKKLLALPSALGNAHTTAVLDGIVKGGAKAKTGAEAARTTATQQATIATEQAGIATTQATTATCHYLPT